LASASSARDASSFDIEPDPFTIFRQGRNHVAGNRLTDETNALPMTASSFPLGFVQETSQSIER
jgi:hypothetical protein